MSAAINHPGQVLGEPDIESRGLYDSLDIHRVMLRDHVRNDAYRAALQAAVTPQKVVLDVGAGTGIMSMLAALAGARHVYAVERSSVAGLMARLIAQNGLADRITVFRGDVERVRLPGPVDVIVSEWLGVYGVDENLLAPVLAARDRWLAPGGRLLPARVTSWLAPVWAEGLEYLRGRPFGLDLGPIAVSDPHEIVWPRTGLPSSALQAGPLPLWTIDLERCPALRARLAFQAALVAEFDDVARVNALAAWFGADFDHGIHLSNAPGMAPTHWNQFLFPLERAYELDAGARLHIRFGCLPAGPGYCQHAWAVKPPGADWEAHDTRWGGGPRWREL